MPAGVLGPPPATAPRPSLASRARRWTVAVLAAAQVLAAVVAAALGGGRPGGTGGAGGTDLLITPAGYAFAVWGAVVAGCLAYAVYQLPAARGDEPAHRRVAWPFAGVMAGFVAWLVLAATAPTWTTALVFAVMLGLLVVAYDTALRHRRLVRLPGRLLLLGTLGVYTGWAAVAVPVNAASALADLGLPTTGSAAAAWQAVVLLVALGAGVAVVRRWRARAASTLAVVWALLAVAFGAGAREGGALLAAAAAVGAVVLLGWAVWMRWEDLRRRVAASTVRLGGPGSPFGPRP
ncbi:hypothetical protein [Quadrisphaera sp. KR29]|uniref:hypothetical protein n=1 Tax=Quadrisphaera sp. KR29 TaxID=3461391 RepID=UPI004044D05A